MIEVLQIFTHLLKYTMDRDIYFVHYPIVDVSNYVLNDFELLKQFSTSFKDILREYIFLTIDP